MKRGRTGVCGARARVRCVPRDSTRGVPMVTLNTHREPHVPSAPRRARARGFTLIEILTVIVILGIASAVIAPQIGSRDDIKAKAGARVVIADLLYAQNMAIAKQAYYYVR